MLPHALLKCEQNKFLVDQAEERQRHSWELSNKKTTFQVPSCVLGMMLTCRRAGLLQGGRSGAARGGHKHLSWSRVSPGRGAMNTVLQHKERRVFLQGDQEQASELSK